MPSPIKSRSQSPIGARIACEQCAKAKTGCDKGKPKCTRCSEKKLICKPRHARRRAKVMRRQDTCSDHNAGSVGSDGTPEENYRRLKNMQQSLPSVCMDASLPWGATHGPNRQMPYWQSDQERAVAAATWRPMQSSFFPSPSPAPYQTRAVQPQTDQSALRVRMAGFYAQERTQSGAPSIPNPQDTQSCSILESGCPVDASLSQSALMSSPKMAVDDLQFDTILGGSAPTQYFGSDDGASLVDFQSTLWGNGYHV